MDISELIEQYQTGSQQLRQAIADMTHDQLAARPIPGKWSTREVVCHIADFEPVYVDRMKRVIAEENPTMFGGDPDRFVARLAYDRRDLDEELALIEAARNHMARILKSLQPHDFERSGTHSEDGSLTLSDLLKRITGHIPHHLRFVEEKKVALPSL